MRIGPIAIVLLLVLAGGVGWWVLTQNDGTSAAGGAATAATGAPTQTQATFDPGAPLPANLAATAESINSARFAPSTGVSGSGESATAGAAASGASASSAAPSAADLRNSSPASAARAGGRSDQVSSATSSGEGRGPEDGRVAERTAGTAMDPAVIRAQVLLDRAHFSPGVIDGLDGENYQNALKAFERDRGYDPDGRLDAQVFAALTEADNRAAVRGYRITEEDVRGPFNPDIPTEMRDMRELDRLSYRNAEEALAEKFHMDVDLLRRLNPQADFARAGAVILVAAVGDDQRLPAEVDRIEVDGARVQVRAYAGDRLLAVYPATVGSSDFPSPSGSMTVSAVAPNPTYTYDPSRLSFGRESNGDQAFTIAAGPNNPVGSTWIDLSEPTYGIHGTPEPAQIGKTASHGCVRLTNWDAAQLGRSVRTGARVTFVGTQGGSSSSSASGRPSSGSSGSGSGSGASESRSGSSGRR